jgi:hypothetical protein
LTRLRATAAIVRRHIDRRYAIDWAMQFLLVGAISFVFGRLFGDPLEIFGIVGFAAAASVIDRQHRRLLRRLTFFTAPLYGRQLARAHAIAPACAALSVPLAYVTGAALAGRPLPADMAAAVTAAALVAATIALSSAFREGYRAALYVGLAGAAALSLGLPFEFHVPRALTLCAALAAVEGFLALRAFGETLARYDPLPEPAAEVEARPAAKPPRRASRASRG